MKKIFLFLAVTAVISSAVAHEYFFSAYHYHVHKGDTLEVHLFVADGLNVQLERPMQTAKTVRFQLLTAGKVTDLLPVTPDNTLPMLTHKTDFDGLGLLVLERNNTPHVMETAKFKAYLKEDHLDNVVIPAAKLALPQRERYSRYIKSLVLCGNTHLSDTVYRKVTGMNMEIVLLNNPYLLKRNDILQVQVYFRGKPLANKVITARNRTGSLPASMQESRTDAKGICRFKLSRSGEWLIHATHMIVSPEAEVSDWDSYWASYSFGLESGWQPAR